MPFVDTATGARLDYEDVGTGAPLIAIHGRLGTPRTDLPNVIDWLSESYRVVAPTLRGYGQSLPRPRDFPNDFYHRDARDVLAMMDALGIEKAHVFGYSDGGEIALILAGMAPDRFLSCMTVGAVGYFGPEIRPIVQANYPATWMTAEDQELHGIDNPDKFALDWIRAMKHMIDSGGDVSLSLASNITCPVLLMLGDRDTLNPEAYGRRLIERTQRGRVVMFACGHGIHFQKWDEFQQVVGDFLREQAVSR